MRNKSKNIAVKPQERGTKADGKAQNNDRDATNYQLSTVFYAHAAIFRTRKMNAITSPAKNQPAA